MNKLLLSLLAATALAGAVPAAASAAPIAQASFDAQGAHLYLAQYTASGAWVSINQRQANLEARINEGIRLHRISATEAASLRAQFRDIANLEARYRATGGVLDVRERTELTQRFDALSARINKAIATPAPAPVPGWVMITNRLTKIDERIDQGVRSGALTRVEAARLRNEFHNLVLLETRYRATGGFSAWERRDLDARFDKLSRQVYVQKHDWQTRH